MSPRKPALPSPLPLAEPEEVGFSSSRLARIRPGLKKYIDQGMVPHLVTLVARHGKIVHYEAQGYMDLDNQQPAVKQMVFRLWSNTKPITGIATMVCVEDGLLALDDPVSKFIPAFKDPLVLDTAPRPGVTRAVPGMIPTVPAQREITVRDCLRNTTGLLTADRIPPEFLIEHQDTIEQLGWFSEGKGRSVREMVEAQARLPLAFQPGTEFEYHVGYPALGVVLEIVTGKSLEEFYQERIFKPVGMKDTSFYLAREKLGYFPTCYRPVQEGTAWKLAVAERPEESEKVTGPKTRFGAGGDRGGVLSTAGDYARFVQMLLNGGELDGVRILGRKTVELMTRSHTRDDLYPPNYGPGFGFGMGVGVYKGGGPPRLRSVDTYGWGGRAGTNFIADPKEDLFMICFTQVLEYRSIPGNSYQEEFERLVYQSLI